MKTNTLGRGGLRVSEFCLGTMTFGTQTGQAEAHAQIDAALAAGINFVDTAEMYPTTPVRAETIGDTETILGAWNASNPGRRADYVLATKVSGEGLKAVRDGMPISRQTIEAAVDASLRRLDTDYIDLYQLHWPNRGSYHFRQNWTYAPNPVGKTGPLSHIVEVLETCQELVKAGKLRHIGLSNETAWGVAQWIRVSEVKQLPRVASIQNEYSLLCRLFDTDLAEASLYEDVPCLSFSPLAAGLLTGKYQDGKVPDGSRKALNGSLGGRATERVYPAVAAYADIAQRHGLDLVHMALAFAASRPFMGSVIFGATSLPQLDHILNGLDLTLTDEVLAEIDAAHRAHPMPY
ncbi:aldo/keto reductase [Tropicimonas sp. S265A]|uniref:aldo/keto reductase n=1 Tax=Tropicimonas sp. S265A TaxID=3415134 RepID=UPI003C7D2F0F